jgi:HEAT repeat protein
LMKALDDEEYNVGYAAAVAIGRIDSHTLIGLLKDSEESIRRLAMYGLGEIGCRQAVPLLLAMLSEKETGYRLFDALGKLGTPELLPRLEPYIHDKDVSVRSSARHAVTAIKRRHGL